LTGTKNAILYTAINNEKIMKRPDDPNAEKFDDISKVKETEVNNMQTVPPQIQKILQGVFVKVLKLDDEGRFEFACRKNPPEDLYKYDPDLRASPDEVIQRAMRLAKNLNAFMPPLHKKSIQQKAQVLDELFRFLCPNFYSKEDQKYNTFPVPVYFPRINLSPCAIEDDEEVQKIYLQCCEIAINTLAGLYRERNKSRMVTVDVPLKDLKVNPEIARRSLGRNGFALHFPLCYSGVDKSAAIKHAENHGNYMLTPADPLAILISALENHDMFNGQGTFGQLFYGTRRKVHLIANWGPINTELIIEKPNMMISSSISSIGLIFQPQEQSPVSWDLP
jgi:hypothetical protein